MWRCSSGRWSRWVVWRSLIGLSPATGSNGGWGWTAVVWLAYILTEGDHRQVTVATYIKGMHHTLHRLTAQVIEPLACSDDRLGHLRHHVSKPRVHGLLSVAWEKAARAENPICGPRPRLCKPREVSYRARPLPHHLHCLPGRPHCRPCPTLRLEGLCHQRGADAAVCAEGGVVLSPRMPC